MEKTIPLHVAELLGDDHLGLQSQCNAYGYDYRVVVLAYWGVFTRAEAIRMSPQMQDRHLDEVLRRLRAGLPLDGVREAVARMPLQTEPKRDLIPVSKRKKPKPAPTIAQAMRSAAKAAKKKAKRKKRARRNAAPDTTDIYFHAKRESGSFQARC